MVGIARSKVLAGVLEFSRLEHPQSSAGSLI